MRRRGRLIVYFDLLENLLRLPQGSIVGLERYIAAGQSGSLELLIEHKSLPQVKAGAEVPIVAVHQLVMLMDHAEPPIVGVTLIDTQEEPPA